MTRIFTPTQLSLFSISRLAAWWEELERNGMFNLDFPEPTELEIRLREEGESLRGIREQTGLAVATIRRIIADNEKVEVGIK